MHKECLERWNYCGFSKVRYQSCQRQIADENWTSARIISRIMLVMMTGFTVLSILNIINRAFYLLYVFFVGCTVIVKVIIQLSNHKNKGNGMEAAVDIGFTCGGLMLFGVLASAADPRQAATLFLASSLISCFFQRERIRSYMTGNHYYMMSRVDGLRGLWDPGYCRNMQWALLQSAVRPCEDLIEALFPLGKQAYIENLRGSCEDCYDLGGDEFAMLIGGKNALGRIEDNRDAQAAYKRADEAMHAAKKNGRNQIFTAEKQA